MPIGSPLLLITGTALMPCASKACATPVIGSSGPTVTTSVVITSRACIEPVDVVRSGVSNFMN